MFLLDSIGMATPETRSSLWHQPPAARNRPGRIPVVADASGFIYIGN